MVFSMQKRNNRKTRILSFALAVLVLVAALIPNSLISEKEAQVPQYLGKYDSDPIASEVQRRLYNGILEQQTYIDFSDISIPLATFWDVWVDLRFSESQLYMMPYMSYPEYRYDWVSYVYYITRAYPIYKENANNHANAQMILNDTVQSIVGNINPNWNTTQIALYLHDYLALNCRYDKSYTYRDAYTMLTQGTGVCEGYYHAYNLLLEAAGMKSDYTLTSDGSHIWNRVFIGGKQYNVDVTGDDPSLDRLGQVKHRYFLVSDSIMDDEHEYTWKEGYGLCSDDYFDDWFWRDVNTAFIPVGDDFYFIYKGSICKWTADNKLEKCVSLSSKWYSDSSKRSYWYSYNVDGSKNYNFSVMWPAGDKILYNATSSIKTFDPKTNKLATVYKYTGKGNICGFSYDEDSKRLTMQVGYDPWKPHECEIITVENFKVT